MQPASVTRPKAAIPAARTGRRRRLNRHALLDSDAHYHQCDPFADREGAGPLDGLRGPGELARRVSCRVRRAAGPRGLSLLQQGGHSFECVVNDGWVFHEIL